MANPGPTFFCLTNSILMPRAISYWLNGSGPICHLSNKSSTNRSSSDRGATECLPNRHYFLEFPGNIPPVFRNHDLTHKLRAMITQAHSESKSHTFASARFDSC